MTEFIIKKMVGTNPLDSPSSRRKLGILSGIIGIFFNILLFLAKFFVGTVTSSIAVSADAFNNLSDAGASVVTLVCFKLAGNPADKEHPFGHGRIEYVSGLIISVAIILTGVSFVRSSIEKIINPEEITFSYISIIILLASMILKLWLGLFNQKLGKLTGSSAMKATGIDSLTDVAVTAATIIGMCITYFTGLYLDAYAGIIVALFIFFTGIKTIKETLDPLVGQAPDPKLVKDISSLVLSYHDVVGIHDLMIHNYGPGKIIISLHAEMPANINILELHETIDKIEKDLKLKFDCQAVIHLDPIVTDDEKVNNIRKKVSGLVKLIDSDATIHDLRVVPGVEASTIIFDIFLPYNSNKPDSEIIDSLSDGVKVIDPSYECIVNVNRTYFDSK